jgi:hypothetical protein
MRAAAQNSLRLGDFSPDDAAVSLFGHRAGNDEQLGGFE